MDETMCFTELQIQCRELLPVIQGGAEGKAIQVQFPGEKIWTSLAETFRQPFNKENKYRLKPGPKYRPYKPAEAVPLLETWIRGQDCSAYDVVAIEKTGVRLSNQELMPYDLLLERFTVRHTTPCGVLVES